MSIGSGLEHPKRGESETPLTVHGGGDKIALVRIFVMAIEVFLSVMLGVTRMGTELGVGKTRQETYWLYGFSKKYGKGNQSGRNHAKGRKRGRVGRNKTRHGLLRPSRW